MTMADSHAGPTFRCVRGDMQLSRVLHDRLTEVFVSRSRNARPRAASWGGRWCCPACGVVATTDGGHVRCPQCGEHLDEFLHQLVELHPHRARLLLSVEATFEIRGRGLVLAPFLPASEARATPFPVELQRPDGTARTASAVCEVPSFRPAPAERSAHLMLLDAQKSDVPIGTRVYVG